MSYTNPVIAGRRGDDHGDPFIVRYLGEYFLYHTGATSGRKGVSVYRSSDLVEWEFAGFALEAREDGWAWSDLWAPEVVYERGTFFMYVSATSRFDRARRARWQTGEGDDAGRRVGVARSQSPVGPFAWDAEPLVETWSIDGHPYRDDDGSMWLFYSVRNELTGFRDGTPGTAIVCDRLESPDTLAGRPRAVVAPSQRWEGNSAGDFYWNEGPYVLKRRGIYYLMYSGGSFTDESYAIGAARAPSATGPWTKLADNPVVQGTDVMRGPGHHSFVHGPDAATRYAVYHAYVAADPGRKVCIDRMSWLGDRPAVAGPTHEPQPSPPQSVYDDAVPHWVAETWARGDWVEVRGHRYRLAPVDVWHQVEVEQMNGRHTVRIGGVLRASRPSGGTHRGPEFAAEGGLGPSAVTSCKTDPGLHELAARSTYEWHWGGSTPVEIVLAARGGFVLDVDGETVSCPGARDHFRAVRVTLPRAGSAMSIEAGDEGATIADIVVTARPVSA